MTPFFGSSRREQVHLLSALESLGSTTVSGLAAALSWSVRKTDRCLTELAGSAAIPITYNRAAGSVTWGDASASVPAPDAQVAPPEPAPDALPTRGPAAAGASPRPSTPSKGAGAPVRSRCPICHSNLAPTGGDDLGYCVACGRLVPLASAVQSIPGLGAAEHKAVAARTTPADGVDRRAQEMFAAYVTSRPIPCPRCRKSMTHRGPGSYACAACGEKVKFPTTELPSPATPAPMSAPSVPLEGPPLP
ncbi:MAG TPA: hypothetical protein VFF67_00250 [Thermoplasmata archaeon]|nr:hypothetical protein [Thermoplasmata archaeon]